jgi:hypothetical protein
MTRKIGGNLIKEYIDVCGTKYEMNASNPCIFKMGDKYYINLRFVNYFLNSNGSYHFPVDDGKIVTVNKIMELDNELNFKTEQEPIILMPANNTLRYVGMEDMKPFCHTDGSISFLGTCQNPSNGNISMGYGELDMEDKSKMSFNYNVVNTPFNKDCEKNWVFYQSTGENGNKELNVIYKWDNLTIGKVVKKELEFEIEGNINDMLYLDINKQKSMPPFFRDVRGSSNGYEFEDDMWFLCHVVEYGTPRIYYHFFAVFDKKTMEIRRWSNLFSFEGEKIEGQNYCVL